MEGRRSNSEDLYVRYACPWCGIDPKNLYDMYTHIYDEHNDKFDYQLKYMLKRSHCVSMGDEDETD